MTDTVTVAEHGGSGMDFIRLHHPDAPGPWLDLSTGICPWPYPYPAISKPAFETLPSTSVLEACRAAAAGTFKVPPAYLAAFPGSQAAISLLPRLFSPRRVSILEPTYNEHARAWHQAGHDVQAIRDVSADDSGILVLTNPNNPDGRLFGRDEILAIAARRSRENRWTVVDEAFIDLIPEESVGDACGRSKLIVFRSFGKFFGLAGLRLGFVVAAENIARRMESMIGPWAVSGTALEVGAAAYQDKTWQQTNRDRLRAHAARQRKILSAAGLDEIGGTDLFILGRHPNAPDLFWHLCEHGIYTRRFPDGPEQLRFGLTADEAGLNRLETVLGIWTSGQ